MSIRDGRSVSTNATAASITVAGVEEQSDALARSSYDDVPYRSHPYSQTCPERLATIATLLGMASPAVDRCRVLEMGCSGGGNLIPVAERFPASTFVGIDASARQIADGQQELGKLGLENVRLEYRDILAIDPNFGQFDYIICHGVYSWVPRQVQDKILAICSQNLSANGVAYISYNTYPGWHMRGVIRDMMLYRASGFDRPADRVRHARSLIDFIAESVPKEENPYGMFLRNEVEGLRDKEDHYLFHEHLEAHNEPLYFHQFMARAETKGLQYLGEADFGSMSSRNLSPQVEKVLQGFAPDLLAMEQYMDFLRNRMFRQTLLCHADRVIDREPSPDRVLGLHVASPAKPEAPLVDVQSKAPAVFRGRRAVTKTTEPVVKAALLHLGNIWPCSEPVKDLIAIARSKVTPELVIVDAAQATSDSRKLADPLIRCYVSGQVEFSVSPPSFVLNISERPRASAWARLQAQSSNRVTNLRHESVSLKDLQRHILRHLDGQHDRAALLDKLAGLAAAGSLVMREDGQSVVDPARLRQALTKPLDESLEELASNALLVA